MAGGEVTTDLDLFTGVRDCTDCGLHKLRGEGGLAVPARVGERATRPLLAIMAEAPGAQENAAGQPLIGRAGVMLNKLLVAAGVDREELLLMNTVRCRPPNNALSSHTYAIVACDKWTREEFRVYNPKVVILMGKSPIQRVFPGANLKVGETRGKARATGEDHEYGARVWVPTYHPAALLRNPKPEVISQVVEDIKLAKALLAVG